MSTVREFDFSVALLENILWQYDGTTALRGLVQQKQDWYSLTHTQFWNDWIDDVFNLDTANDFGLAVWAIILGVPLVVVPPPDPNKDPFGFASDDLNFNNSNFANTGGSFGLTTAQKRLVLKLRYFQLITRGAVPEVNAFLSYLFGPGYVYLADGLNMHQVYVFSGPIPSAVELVLTSFDLLPRPAGVGSGLVFIGDADGFGFGRYHENFNNGNFYHGP
jgi:hypothetical protein